MTAAGGELLDVLVVGGRAEQVRARYVVGCDGARSTVRRAAKIAFQGGAYPQTFALADLRVGRQGGVPLWAGGRGGGAAARGALVLQGSKLVAAGNVGPFFDFGLARCKADGTLDRSFGSGGKVTTDFGC